ncbi:mitochondrial enolase superfamily member 1-like isoform X2 [Fopius arisanus]|uniref:Mitochondrial enolase superfamily member 1 n=1 Tax=Fopius arisanus TaxID=64838 RepID=A0A9R1U9W6_9HYME|nr:PREDICTED: mitochondrial enolase superfamily member 1-like isoform X2 [Fopius arisanus]
MVSGRIIDAWVKDIRFPTSLNADGSDAMHTDPDYSCAYVMIKLENNLEGFGLTFTLGRGTEIVVSACQAILKIIMKEDIHKIFNNFGEFWRKLGPEKGVIHLATAAVINALWDLWAKSKGVPLWKLLVDLTPETLVSTIDFRYISDVITRDEAIKILKDKQSLKLARENRLLERGLPAYTTQVGWLGYSNEKVRALCRKYISLGFTHFKVKVGHDIDDDIRRLRLIRQEIGEKNILMLDANQMWEIDQAIEWMNKLKEFKPYWIEEPTSPDDILGHAKIAKALRPLGIGTATGETCANRIIFKQLLQAKAIDFCQIDAARLGGVNEILSVYLMAYTLGVPVCPHAGGIGLCEMVQHLQMWDFVSLSGTTESRIIEYVDQQHDHFVNPSIVENAHYRAPNAAGYSTQLKKQTLIDYEYPHGRKWQEMFDAGIYERF